MENNDLEKINNSEDFNDSDDFDNSSEVSDLNHKDIKEGLSINREVSSKRSNKDIRVYTMPEEFFNKKYQISRAKRLVEVKKEQEIMEGRRIIEEKKRMKRIEKENLKIEKEKRKRIQVETVNTEKLKKEYEKRQKLIEKNRIIQEEKLKKEKEKEEDKLRKKQELILKDIEERKLKEIKEEKEIKEDTVFIEEDKKTENILEKSAEKTEKTNLKDRIILKFSLNRKKNFSEYFSNTIDGDDVNSDIKNKIDKKILDSVGDVNQKSKNKNNKKESNFLFIFISIIIFVISVIITILITYRNGEWFYYEEEIYINNNNTIYWNNLIEDEKEKDKLIINSEDNEYINNEEIIIDNKEGYAQGDNIINEEENNNIESEIFYYYEKCNFFVTDINFGVPIDSDFDCLTDKEEIIYGTLNNNPDSDSDSYIDGLEVSYVYDPLTFGKIYDNTNLKEYKDELNKFSFYYPKSFEFKTIDGNIFRIIPEKDSYEYFEIELLGSFDLSSLGRITKSSKIKQVDAWVSDSSDYVYISLSNGDVLRIYYNYENIYLASDQYSLNYQASFSLIVRSVYIW